MGSRSSIPRQAEAATTVTTQRTQCVDPDELLIETIVFDDEYTSLSSNTHIKFRKVAQLDTRFTHLVIGYLRAHKADQRSMDNLLLYTILAYLSPKLKIKNYGFAPELTTNNISFENASKTKLLCKGYHYSSFYGAFSKITLIPRDDEDIIAKFRVQPANASAYTHYDRRSVSRKCCIGIECDTWQIGTVSPLTFGKTFIVTNSQEIQMRLRCLEEDDCMSLCYKEGHSVWAV
eukprot:CAMPEP_0197035468 /NCGR_PEP_ID=MMETSP1384-20130603/13262_1 /TAXON_ID=29189 /ORGANISM="Ammonia sp." /LENGTH=232 /DNA_ID=CAMNT_0042465537 /DNA_START=9 /DNA_END=703 /DNA_ORIENTATION=+